MVESEIEHETLDKKIDLSAIFKKEISRKIIVSSLSRNK